MTHRFRLFWFREATCHVGSPANESDLDPAVRERVVALVGKEERDIEVHMPFLDKREINRREETLEPVQFRREGNVIRAIPRTANSALRNHAANLLQLDAAWKDAPRDHRRYYFPTWQRVSVLLQKELRAHVLARYMRCIDALEDRDASYPVLVYAASRLCYGRPRTEFTYDIADPDTLPSALKLMNRSLQGVLADIEACLRQAGKTELARRYAPIWHEDIRREILNNPRAFLMILGDEATFVNSVIDLGTSGQMDAVKPFARTALSALRNIYRMDLRDLAIPLLDRSTQALAEASARYQVSDEAAISQSEQEGLYPQSLVQGTFGHYKLDSATCR
jgi:hypothetical protein